MKKSLAAAAFGASVVSLVMLLLRDGAPVAPAPVSLSLPALADAIKESGAQGSLNCTRGVVSNHPERVYCTDGGTAGFLLDDETGDKLLGDSGSVTISLATGR